MFKKEATFKSTTAIRNSERKGLVAQVKHQFRHALHGKGEEEVQDIILDILPPSGIEAAAFSSTKGHRGILYTHAGTPIFIKYADDDKLIPTLPTLWKACLVTTALTGAQVLSNLQAGSDLMIKGMFEYTPDVKQGDVVAVRCTGKAHVVAVGVAALDFKDVDREQGGKGILLVSCLGDTITKDDLYPVEAGQEAEAAAVASGAPVEQVQAMTLDSTQQQQQQEAQKDTPNQEDAGTAMNTEQIDEAFMQALLFGLYTIRSESRDLTLPIPASTLIDAHVLPYLSAPGLTFKQTSWKKASKFLAKQAPLIRCKGRDGQVVVTGIDWLSDALAAFVPYRLPVSTNTASSTLPQQQHVQHGDTASSANVMHCEELYRVPATHAALCPDLDRDALHSVSNLGDALETYYTHNPATTNATTSRKLITLDPVLYHLLGNKTSQRQLSRDVLLRALLKACTLHHRLNGGKIKKGPVPHIAIIMESRQGRKSVTRLVHLERFFDVAQISAISDAIKHKCAVSVSLGEVKGTKPGSSVEMMVQGKKAPDIVDVLLHWGVKKTWMDVEDKTK